jgi:ribosome-binding factor A
MHIKRSQRVAEVLKREISHILMEEIKDPAINLVTITTVKLTNDLKFCKIYFTVLGSLEQRDRATQALQRATKFIRSEIGRKVELRYIPELTFEYDTVIDNAEHIDSLIQQIKKEDL